MSEQEPTDISGSIGPYDPYIHAGQLEQELTDLKAKYQKAKRTIDFYATYSPFQFPEGYYEICIEKGVGGHNRFGTLARQTLAELGEKE